MHKRTTNSSFIKYYGYEFNKFFLQFKDSPLYEYIGVPPDVFDEFLKAKSKGSFFHKSIKNKYLAKRRDN